MLINKDIYPNESRIVTRRSFAGKAPQLLLSLLLGNSILTFLNSCGVNEFFTMPSEKELDESVKVAIGVIGGADYKKRPGCRGGTVFFLDKYPELTFYDVGKNYVVFAYKRYEYIIRKKEIGQFVLQPIVSGEKGQEITIVFKNGKYDVNR